MSNSAILETIGPIGKIDLTPITHSRKKKKILQKRESLMNNLRLMTSQ